MIINLTLNENLNDELLEQLMLRGVLPKSGFPTDIVNLNIFDTTDDDNGRKIKLEHTPSYPLSTAITAYAPGSTRTIDGYVYTSHGIYTFNDEERKQMYNKRATYFKCENCGQIDIDYSVQEKDLQRSCQTCNSLTLESRLLIKPVGFAHSRAIPPESGFDKEAGSGRSQVMTRMKTPDEMHLLEGYENITAMSVGTLFVTEVLGGLILGTFFGYFGLKLLKYIENEFVELEVLITLSLVLVVSLIAFKFHLRTIITNSFG